MKRFILLLALIAPACDHDGGGVMDLGPASCDPNPCVEASRSVCRSDGNGVMCLCDPGTHDEGGECKPDTQCTATTCGGHGTCSTEGGGLSCRCDTGYGGMWCQDCAAGWYSDGKGGCVDDPCKVKTCGPMQECHAGACVCRPGTHDENGQCVMDQTCMPNTCAGHGTCHEANGMITCECAMGYTGPTCGSCTSGYHDDGHGGCTNDPCTPNPCTMAHKTVCTPMGASASCGCDAGYHLSGAACLPDETCTASSCSMHGTCSVNAGVVQCACATGYTGASCDACASGYHSDGMGGCTNDPCTPNPCTMANKTTCTAMGTTAVCGCDAGYHSDGVGGCTNDPCTPNTCAATNQACRVVGGMAQCYTPTCDDANPCTTDSLVGGVCMHANVTNGNSCSTTLCQVGQTCQSGVCQGGTPRVCNDGNPCTRDSCDAVLGCRAVNDDTLVPDDSIDCTTDKCTAGAASHMPSDALCDDGKWCTGTEKCQPGAGADARGCKASAVPVAPVLTPNGCSSYHCDEVAHGFVLDKQAPATPCSDGNGCTTGDACRADGSCAGVAVASCPPPACGSTTAFQSAIDISYGNVGGAVRMSGAALPATTTGGGNIGLKLVAKDTGAEHYIDVVSFSYQGSGIYNLTTGANYTTRLIPGVYDLYYERDYNSQYNYVNSTYANDNYTNGRRVLQTGVVIGTGVNALDIDLPSSSVSGTIRMNGAALPATTTGGGNIGLKLVAKDTGAEHYLDVISFSYQGSGVYNLTTGSTYSTHVLPGIYDLVYERDFNSQYNYVNATYANDNYINGRRVLQTNVAIAGGANTLDVDLPSSSVGGTIRMNGAALPATTTGGGNIGLKLVAKDTGAEHYIDVVSFSYQGSGIYNLTTGATYSTHVLPGVYDLLYERDFNSQYHYVNATYANDNYINGRRVLQTNVVIAAGANTLDVDLPSSSVSGTVKLNGAALPATTTGGGNIGLKLVAKDTGAEHYIDVVSFSYQGSGIYNLTTGATYATHVLPGLYDLLYERDYNSQYNYVNATYATDNYANGRRVLVAGVTIGAGANTLDIDVPVRAVAGSITVGGAAPPSTTTGGGNIGLKLAARDTRAEHYLDVISFSYQGSGIYNLTTGTTYSTKMIPGIYDLIYERDYNSQYHYVNATYSTDNYANGRRHLSSCIVLP